jgi:hypothetical protein
MLAQCPEQHIWYEEQDVNHFPGGHGCPEVKMAKELKATPRYFDYDS